MNVRHSLFKENAPHFKNRILTMKTKITSKAAVSITVLSIFLLWYFLSTYTDISPMILPTPCAVWRSFWEVLQEGYGPDGYNLLSHFIGSMKRMLTAFVLIVFTAIPIGLICGRYRMISNFLNPIIVFYRPLPPLAYYTLLVLWMGIGENSKIMLLYLAGFAPLYIACVSGVGKVKNEYIVGAEMLGANKYQVFFHVILPAVLPDIFSGIRIAVGVEYTTLVAAEMVAAKTGLGWMVLDASKWLRSDIVFMGVIIMGITGILINSFMLSIEAKVVHWKGKNR